MSTKELTLPQGATSVTFNVVAHSKHLVIDRLWTRSGQKSAWGPPKHTGDTVGDDRDSVSLTSIGKQHEVVYHLLIETVNSEASGDYDLEIEFTHDGTTLPDGRWPVQGKVDKGIAVVERLVRFL
jgi:hypothetical protein